MSTQTYALLFYGFPVEEEDVPEQGFKPWELDERIPEAGLGRKVRCVCYGPYDEYSYALAIHKPFVQVDDYDLLKPVPKRDAKKEAEWNKRLQAAALVLGVKFKKPGWYLAPWRF